MTIKELAKKINSERFDLKGVEILVYNDATGEEFRVDAVELVEGERTARIVIEKQNVR